MNPSQEILNLVKELADRSKRIESRGSGPAAGKHLALLAGLHGLTAAYMGILVSYMSGSEVVTVSYHPARYCRTVTAIGIDGLRRMITVNVEEMAALLECLEGGAKARRARHLLNELYCALDSANHLLHAMDRARAAKPAPSASSRRAP